MNNCELERKLAELEEQYASVCKERDELKYKYDKAIHELVKESKPEENKPTTADDMFKKFGYETLKMSNGRYLVRNIKHPSFAFLFTKGYVEIMYEEQYDEQYKKKSVGVPNELILIIAKFLEENEKEKL